MESPAVPIGERVSYIPDELAVVLDRALREAADGSTYYQSAQVFKQDLLAVTMNFRSDSRERIDIFPTPLS